MEKTKTGIILILVLMIGGVSAYYAGEPFSIILPQDYEYYSIVGNSTPIDLTLTQDGLNLTVVTNKYQQNDTFELVFFDINSEVIHHYSGGGGTSVRYVDRNITIESPKYIDKEVIKEIQVEKIVDNIIISENEYEWWDILLAIAVGGGFVFFIMHKKKDKTAEEIIEELGDGEEIN